MVDGGAEPGQRLEMLGHAVAHVALEAVAGMREAEPRHQPVARDLGDDRGRRDRGHQRVARRSPPRNRSRSRCGRCRRRTRAAASTGSALHRARQRPQRGAQDVVAVDARGRAERDRDLRAGADLLVELLALLGVELLGIVEPARDALGIENDGGGDHRAGERSPARLVAAGDRPDPLALSARRSRRKVGRSDLARRAAGAARPRVSSPTWPSLRPPWRALSSGLFFCLRFAAMARSSARPAPQVNAAEEQAWEQVWMTAPQNRLELLRRRASACGSARWSAACA